MRVIYRGIVALSLAATIGIATYDARDAALAKAHVKNIRAKEKALAAELGVIEGELAVARGRLEGLPQADENLRNQAGQVFKLRGEVTQLRAERSGARTGTEYVDSTESRLKELLARCQTLKGLPERFPHHAIPEISWMEEDDWMELAKFSGSLEEENVARRIFKEVRRRAKLKFGMKLHRALQEYLKSNNGRLPQSVAELKPHFEESVEDAVLRRYEMVRSGGIAEASQDTEAIILGERAPADPLYDTRLILVSTNKIMTEDIYQTRYPWDAAKGRFGGIGQR